MLIKSNKKNSLFLRIARWINEEEDRIKSSGETSLQYVILDMSGKYVVDLGMIERIINAFSFSNSNSNSIPKNALLFW